MKTSEKVARVACAVCCVGVGVVCAGAALFWMGGATAALETEPSTEPSTELTTTETTQPPTPRNQEAKLK